MSQELLSGLLQELRRGTIVLSVLSQLKEPKYGYHLVNTLEKAGLPVEANTLYPLLRRLESQGLLTSSWEVGQSKPRKYYCITPYGEALYLQLKDAWNNTVQHMNVLLEDTPHEP